MGMTQALTHGGRERHRDPATLAVMEGIGAVAFAGAKLAGCCGALEALHRATVRAIVRDIELRRRYPGIGSFWSRLRVEW